MHRNRIQRVVAVGLAWLGVLYAPSALAYAQGWQKYVKNVEVRINDSFHAMDGDLNLGIVAIRGSPGYNRYFKLFWDEAFLTRKNTGLDVTGTAAAAAWSRRINEILNESETDARKDSSCKKCMDDYPDYTQQCLLFGADLSQNGCRALLNCTMCNWYLSDEDPGDNTDLDMLLFQGVGEVELPDDTEDVIYEKLGLAECNSADDKHGSCGKKAFVSGLLTHDQTHHFKPELHPLHSIMIEDVSESSSHRVKKAYRLGAFIDGSGTDYYRNPDSTSGDNKPPNDTVYPSTVVFDFDEFQGQSPGAGWTPFCRWREYTGARLHVTSPAKQADWKDFPGGKCQKLSIAMDKRNSDGASWAGEVELGWARAELQVSAHIPAFSGKIMARPPGAPATGGPPTGTLYRWWEYFVTVSATVPAELENTHWEFSPSSTNVLLLPAKPVLKAVAGKPGQVQGTFSAWVPVSESLVKSGASPYDEVLTITLKAGEQVVIQDVTRLHVNPPVAEITTPREFRLPSKPPPLTPRVELCAPLGSSCQALPKFVTSVSSRVKGFTDNDAGVQQVWRLDGKEAPAPKSIALCDGQSVTVGLVAKDAKGVESASQVKLFNAPRFVGVAKVERPIARLGTHPATVKVVAQGRLEEPEPFSGTPPGPVQVKWHPEDFQYASEKTGGAWKPLPNASYTFEQSAAHKGVPGDEDTVVINAAGLGAEVHFSVSVTVKDAACRTADAYAVTTVTTDEPTLAIPPPRLTVVSQPRPDVRTRYKRARELYTRERKLLLTGVP